MLEIVLAVLNASTLVMVAIIQNTNTKNKKVSVGFTERSAVTIEACRHR